MMPIRISILLVACLMIGCDKNRVYEKNVGVKEYKWDNSVTFHFDVEIDDTISLYNLFLNIRHTNNYPFTNLWVNLKTTFPSGRSGDTKQQLVLGDNKRGKWNGDCMNDICDAQLVIWEMSSFPEYGEYRFEVSHLMRTNPLPSIMDVGLRLEKEIN